MFINSTGLLNTKHDSVAPKAPNELAAVIKFLLPQFHTEISVSQCNPNQLNSSQPFPAALTAFHEMEDMKYQEQRVAGS